MTPTTALLSLFPVLASIVHAIPNILHHQPALINQQQQNPDISSIPTMNPFCLVRNCMSQIVQCNWDSDCRSMLFCTAACFGNKKCQMKCSLQYGIDNKAVFAFLSCIKQNKCANIEDEEDEDHKKCAAPLNPLPEYQLMSMKGKWWVEYGWSDVYDCWPCQVMAFTPHNQTYLDYQYDMLVAPNVLRTIPCHVTQPAPLTSHLKTNYRVLNVFDGHDDWYVMDVVDDKWMLLYYCGYGDISQPYQGAIVMTRNGEGGAPRGVLDRFETILQLSGTGLSMSKFCHNEIIKCPQRS